MHAADHEEAAAGEQDRGRGDCLAAAEEEVVAQDPCSVLERDRAFPGPESEASRGHGEEQHDDRHEPPRAPFGEHGEQQSAGQTG